MKCDRINSKLSRPFAADELDVVPNAGCDNIEPRDLRSNREATIQLEFNKCKFNSGIVGRPGSRDEFQFPT